MWPDVIIRRQQWCEIQEAINWAVDQKLNFERSNLTTQWEEHFGRPIAVKFMFDHMKDAMMFKLRWGGQ